MPPFRAQVGQLSPIGILPRFRGVAEWGRIVEGRYFTDPTGRRAAKAVVDWACGALSVVAAIALSEGTAWFGVSATIKLINRATFAVFRFKFVSFTLFSS